MRQGEALGLTWPMVDLDAESLTISWQLQSLRYNEPRKPSSGFRIPDGYEARQLKGTLHLVRPKSAKGWRVIPLVEWMTDRAHRMARRGARTTRTDSSGPT
jgi:hypothetical protein